MFALFTSIMFGTQVSAIWYDETGIEALKKEEVMFPIYKVQVEVSSFAGSLGEKVQVEIYASSFWKVLSLLVLPLLQAFPPWQAARILNICLTAADHLKYS